MPDAVSKPRVGARDLGELGGPTAMLPPGEMPLNNPMALCLRSSSAATFD